MEDIIRERAEEATPGEELMFFDPTDDLNEAMLEEDFPSSLTQNGSLGGTTAEVPIVSELSGVCFREKTLQHRGIHTLGVALTEW